MVSIILFHLDLLSLYRTTRTPLNTQVIITGLQSRHFTPAPTGPGPPPSHQDADLGIVYSGGVFPGFTIFTRSTLLPFKSAPTPLGPCARRSEVGTIPHSKSPHNNRTRLISMVVPHRGFNSRLRRVRPLSGQSVRTIWSVRTKADEASLREYNESSATPLPPTAASAKSL
jgi:hypothetical protein